MISNFFLFAIQTEGSAAARAKPAATRETAVRLGHARAVAATVSSFDSFGTRTPPDWDLKHY